MGRIVCPRGITEQLESANETRDVWMLYLDRGMFEEAIKYAQVAHLFMLYPPACVNECVAPVCECNTAPFADPWLTGARFLRIRTKSSTLRQGVPLWRLRVCLEFYIRFYRQRHTKTESVRETERNRSEVDRARARETDR